MQKIIMFSLTIALTALAYAGNSIYPIGVNARGAAMGGVEVAVPADSIGIFSNPANITTNSPHSFSFTLGASTSFTYVNGLGDDEQTSKFEVYPLGSFSYAYRLKELPISFGFGVYPIVGAGAKYPEFDLGGGVVATLESEFAFLKASPTMAIHITDNLSIGASFEIGYARLKSDNFSELAVIGGHKLDADAIAYGGKFGAYYHFYATTIAAVYTLKTPLRFEGEFEEGNDKQDLEIFGFEIPHVFELGISHSILPNLLIGLEVSYYLWDDSFNDLKFQRDNADNSVNPNPLVTPLDWRNQVTMAIGIEYLYECHSIRLGYNYGENPVSRVSVTPTFSAIIEHHITVGYGRKYGNWNFDFSYDYELPRTKTSKNPAFFDATQNTSAHIVYCTMRYQF